MRKTILLLLVSFICFGISTTKGYANDEVTWKEVKTVEYSDKSEGVTIIWTDLNDDMISVETAISPGGIGTVDTLEKIVLDQNDVDGTAFVGINGSFFNAYADLQVAGTVVEEGEVRHITESGSSFLVNGDNNIDVSQLDITIYGGINGLWQWPNTWEVWGINHFSTNEESTTIFDAEYNGVMPTHNFTGIVVEDGIVTNIEKAIFEIPSNGFLVLTNNEENLSRISLGDTLDYKFEIKEKNTDNELVNLMTAVGAGPTLVDNGVKVLDAVGEGFTEAKITTQSAGRSIIGVNDDNELAMFTLSGVTLDEAAEICLELGLIKAINLDGGASSGLYYNGSYITKPSREISNAIVIRKLDQRKIHVEINNQEIFFDSLPFVDPNDNRTLVPLRKIAEEIGSIVSYEAETKSIVITRYDTVIKLQVGSDIAYVNDKEMVMDTEVVVRNSRSFVPVRYITEYFGGEVVWDGESKTVELTMEDSEKYFQAALDNEESGDYDLALENYLKVLEIDDSRVDAAKNIAFIYNIRFEDKESAIYYYELAIELDSDDYYSINSLAWIYFSFYNYDEALALFERYVELNPDHYVGYYGIALINENWRVDNQEKAKEYFQITLTKNPPDYAIEYIYEYLGY